MKKLLLIACTFIFIGSINSQSPCFNGMADIYPCNQVDLLAHIPLADIGGGANTNDIWGYVSPNTGKEFALVGCSNGTAFVDISNPVNPEYLGLLPTHTVNSLWRDLETFGHYCFIVSEAPGHGLQVFDLNELDNVVNGPVEFDETTHYGGFGHCHTLTINTQTGFCYCVGTDTYDGGLHIVNINDPVNPTLAGGFSADGYTHDCYTWVYDGPDANWLGKELVFACNEDQLTIVNTTVKTDCSAIGAYDYEGVAPVGYIHQGWVTKDKKHFLIDDELDEINIGNAGDPYGTRTHIFDITDLDNANYVGYYQSENISIDHNLYVKDQFVYESNYRSGLRILDAVKVSDGILQEVGFFDLYPQNDFAQFSGTWSNYPYLPSGVNIATSMYDGFFILKPTLVDLSQNNWELCGANEIIFDVHVNAELAFPLTAGIQGLPGATVSADPLTESGTMTVTVSGLAAVASGNYFPDLLLNTSFGQSYAVPFELHKSSGVASAPELLNVPNGTVISNTATSTLFEWSEVADASQYEIQIAIDATFNNTIEVQITDLTNYLMTFDLPDDTYYWRVRSINNCGEGAWSDVYTFGIGFVSVNELATSALRIFPSPADDVLNIVGITSFKEIIVTDLAGRTIIHQTTPSQEEIVQLNVSSLTAGMYLLKVNGEVHTFMKD